MPQSGTSVSVESVDPVFQTKMLEMLKQTDRAENVVGWYHSHPGFGCWLSSVDVNTHGVNPITLYYIFFIFFNSLFYNNQSFEKLDSRNIAVVVDPIQSVKGKVVIDAFRLINRQLMMMGQEFKQSTSVVGHIKKPTVQALMR